ncbi:MAG: hypothetical protein MZW92_00495 [Comamonadaceae bacterium]|nr:hypothetical protein [Comamonadaceae bacterium]
MLGGMGNISGRDPRRACCCRFVPEVLRYTVEPAAAGAVRPDADRPGGDPHAAVRPGAGADDAASARPACCRPRCASASWRDSGRAMTSA